MKEECNALELKTNHWRGGGGGGEEERKEETTNGGEKQEALVFKTIILQSVSTAL